MTTAQLLREEYEHARRAISWTVEGMTDREYFWKPVADCWSIIEGSDGRWRPEFGTTGGAKVTTIAWRLTHLAVGSAVYYDYVFGEGTAKWEEQKIPSSASAAIELLEFGMGRHADAMARVSDDQLSDARPTHWGAQLPLWQMLWTSIVETFHHGAEIGLLRDMYRGRARADWWPELQDGRALAD